MKATAATAEQLVWLERRTGCVLTRNATGIAAVDKQGRTRGVVAYDNPTANAAQAHWALDAPIALRCLLPAVFAYPFQECGKGLLLAFIPASNRASLWTAKRLGMRETHRVRDGWATGEDLVELELRREDCRHLSPRKAA